MIAAAAGAGLKGIGVAIKFLFFSGNEKQNIVANIKKTIADAKKTTADANRIEQDKEIAWANYLKGVFNELQELQNKHNGEIKIKNDEIARVLKENVDYLAKYEELEFIGQGAGKAVQRLMSKLDIPYWEADGNGENIFVNGAWLELFNVRKDNIRDWLKNVVEEDRQLVLQEWERRIIDQDAETGIRFRIRGRDGQIITVQSIYSIIRTDDNSIHKIIGVTIPRPFI